MTGPLILVTLGTDHHPFDRLVAWIERWVDLRGVGCARFLIQTGATRPPRVTPWRDYLPPGEFESVVDRAAAVVTHGGSTVVQCRRRGHVPIVVPRRPELGEHVDDHQVRLAKMLAERGQVWLADSEDRLHTAIDLCVQDPMTFRTAGADDGPTPAVERFEEAVRRLFQTNS